MASTKIAEDPIAVATAWERIRDTTANVLRSPVTTTATASDATETLCTRIAAADVCSSSLIPKAPVSIKDGFAVRSADAPSADNQGFPTRHIVSGKLRASATMRQKALTLVE